MIKNRAVLNSDTVNRYGYRFTVSSLEDALELKALEGVPTCLGHDIHQPLGWTTPFGLYFEPGMCRLVGSQIIAETPEEQKLINEAHSRALQKRYYEDCQPYLEDFKKIIGSHLSNEAQYLYTSCVTYRDVEIAERLFPKLFAKQDKDGLIYLSDLLAEFTYKGHGVFKDNNSEVCLIAHQYFRKSLSVHNNINYFLIDALVKQASNPKVRIRIAIDRNLIGYSKTFHEVIELEYWRGPKFNNDISKIRHGVTVFGTDDFQRYYYGISQTEFWWKDESGKKTLEVEELKEHPSNGVDKDNYGCRYIHSIFDEHTGSFEHFDGAIRMYDSDKMIERLGHDIKSAGKNSEYTKLFRVDGELPIEDWKSLVCHYFQANPLIHEYFEESKDDSEVQPYIIQDNQQTVLEKLVPYSMDFGDGIRLFVSYHPVEKRGEEPQSDRYISNYDILSIGGESIRVIENEVIEVKKALKRLGAELYIDEKIPFARSEDLYWNIPTISHKSSEKLESNISVTLHGLRLIFEALHNRKKNKVVSFSLSWHRNADIQVTVSVLGHCNDIYAWLKDNKNIPVEREPFKEWLEKQRVFINKYPEKKDKPTLFEMVCGDGVLYIKRRGISPEIKYELKQEERNLMIQFAFPKDHLDTAHAYRDKQIDVAAGYLYKKLECSACKKDYRQCEHSKVLDKGITEIVQDFELISLVWTDKKA